MRFSDGHCHFDFPAFDADRNALIQEALARGVHRLVVPSVTADQCRTLPAFARSWSDDRFTVRFGAGLHPWFLSRHQAGSLAAVESVLASEPDCCAVGEIGLHGPGEDMDRQVALFEDQLALARQYHLPVIIHQVKSHNELVRALKRQPPVGGLLHAFSGSTEMGEEYIRLGLKLGIGGTITWPRARKTRRAASELPATALVLETDAPDMPLAGFAGLRNSPLQIPSVFRSLCRLKPEADPTRLAGELEKTVTDLFG